MYALLISDDDDHTAIFSLALQRAGLAVTIGRTMEQAMQSWVERPADIILLALTSRPPAEQIQLVRSETIVPLIIYRPTFDEIDHVNLLKQGGDLIISPPYSLKLVIAQIEGLLRRASSIPLNSLPTLSTTGLTLNPEDRTVSVANKPPQRLTQLEFRLLHTLMMNRGHIVPTETIVERVWGYNGQGDRELIRGLVSRLRSKIEADPRQPQFIITSPGIGYHFTGEIA